MAKNLSLYLGALKQLDNLDADSRVLNHFRISLFKEFPEQDMILTDQFNMIALNHFKSDNPIIDVIKSATSNQEETSVSLAKVNDLFNLF